MAVLSLNDYKQASYGQDGEAVQNLKIGQVIGGRFQGTPGTITDGEFGIANVSQTGNLMVDVVGGEIIASLGTVDVVKAGSVVVTNGTIASVAAGTVSIVNNPITQVLNVSALATAAGSAFGTLSAASGAGTSHVVSGLQVVVSAGTVDVYVGFGTALTGGSVLARGQFEPGGGIARDFSIPVRSGTNSEICWELAGAGTAFVAVNYWKV